MRKKRTYVKRAPEELVAEAAEDEAVAAAEAAAAEAAAAAAEAAVVEAKAEAAAAEAAANAAAPGAETPAEVAAAAEPVVEEDLANIDPEILRQRAAARRKLKDAGQGNVQIEGMETCDWVLLDTGDIIIHIFRPEVREFYNLEKMWGGAATAQNDHGVKG